MTSSVRDRLRAGEVVHGTWVMYVRTPSILRMIGAAGLDFAFVDMQHSSFDSETVADMCEFGRAVGVAPIVRPAASTPASVARILDWGAVGIMFSDVRGRAEIDDYVAWMRHPPRGARSVSVGGPSAHYRLTVDSAYLEDQGRQTILAVQVESAEGVAAIEEIAGHPEVDLVEIGRNDLAASFGIPGNTTHRRVWEAVQHVVDVCGRQGICVGVNARNAEDAADLRRAGVRCLSYSSDKAILGRQYRAFREDIAGGP